MRNLPMWAGHEVVANSDAVVANLERSVFRRARVQRVYNGIPARPAPREVDRVAGSCVFAGRLSWLKGYEVFVEAAAVVADGHPDAEFKIIGGPAPGEEWRLPRLRERLAELGIADRTEVVGEVDDLPRILDSTAVVVVPSRWPESFGLVTVEAMRSGCAVVASDIGATSEIIVDGETGILVPPDDADSLATAVARLLDDAPLRERMGRAAREHVLATFPEERFRTSIQRLWQTQPT
jgi:mannosyltransferase